jgi:hypothetical protein
MKTQPQPLQKTERRIGTQRRDEGGDDAFADSVEAV